MITLKQACAKVTDEWLQTAAEDPRWQPEKYALAELMVKNGLTPWVAGRTYRPRDEKNRTTYSLARIAREVAAVILEEFGAEDGKDPIEELLDQIEEQGYVWVPNCHRKAMRAALARPGLNFVEHEQGILFVLV